MKKRLGIFGSTGYIGEQTLAVIDRNRELFEVEVLTGFENFNKLIFQAKKFLPNVVVIGNPDYYEVVSNALQPMDIKVYAGAEAIEQVAAMNTIDMVVMAISGFSAFKPLKTALENKTAIALANKECMVSAGEWIRKKAISTGTVVIPVDSEPSAIFQCLAGEKTKDISKIILTASGGPFLRLPLSQFKNITPEAALRHPKWKMGRKISVDSASMMNKGLEAIEARWFFGLEPDQIEVLIHEEAIIHSLVQFSDGSMKAQLSVTDMSIPIQYALGYPERLPGNTSGPDLAKIGSLHFEAPDIKKFRNLALAFEALKKGGNMPCILNAANEIAVHEFLQKNIEFIQIPLVVENCMKTMFFISDPSLDELMECDRKGRKKAAEFIKTLI